MLFRTRCSKKTSLAGVSLVEILISLTIFSTALVGLFMGMNGVNQSITLAMRRDIEASYANMLISQVNPYDLNIETAYDVNSTACTAKRCSMTLPYGEKIYYTRLVSSQPTTADVKEINVYLYRADAGGTPYRQFRKEIALKKSAYYLTCQGGEPLPYIRKDPSGQVWTRLGCSSLVNLTAGSYTPGVPAIINGCSEEVGICPTCDITGAMQYTDATGTLKYYNKPFYTLFRKVSNPITIKFPATYGQLYTISIGFVEFNAIAANTRKMDILINDQTVGSIDVISEAGGINRAIVKTFNAKPIMDTSATPNVAILKIGVVPNAAATNPETIMANVVIERKTD